MLIIRDATADDIPEIDAMVNEFVKGHPAEPHPRSPARLREAYFGARRAGAQFLHGGGDGRVAQLYERVAIGHATRNCYLSGEAFQVVADLDELSPRDIVRHLPDPELGRQPAQPREGIRNSPG